jgi:hypothetical protein
MAAAALLSCGCAVKRPSRQGPDRFVNPVHGMRFEIPAGFRRVSGKQDWDLFKWRHESKPVTLLFQVFWNKDLKYFTPESSLDIFFSNYRASNPESSVYVEKSIKFQMTSADITAVYFEAVDGSRWIQGLHAVANNREYVIRLEAPAPIKDSAVFQDAWNTVKKSFGIDLLPDYKKYVAKILEEQDLEGENDLKEILDYGQQLMSGKEAYARNYPRAIQEFRKALTIMENMNPKPPEHNRALRLLTIAKELQRKAFRNHELLFVKAYKLKNWEEAAKQADIMQTLMQDDKESPQYKLARGNYRYAVKRVKR